jgi:TfoX-like protein
MAYEEAFAGRIRNTLGKRKGLVERKMFGGIAFLLNGNMCCGIHQNELIIRIDPEATDATLAQPHTRRFDLTGRPMDGWILVAPKGIATDAQLGKWVAVAVKYAGALPPKRHGK